MPSRVDENIVVRRRVLALGVVLALLAIAPTYKLVGVQLGDGAALAERGHDQRVRERRITALRGSILDRNGVELAISVPTKRVVADMRELRAEGVETEVDLRQFARLLGEALELEPDPLAGRLVRAGADDPWVRLAEAVDEPVAAAALERIEAEGIIGAVHLEDSTHRVHPAGDSALRLIGTLGIDGPGELAGVERTFDDELSGVDGRVVVEIGSRGQTITGSERMLADPDPGADVHLTLDRALQHEVERVLADAAARTGAERAIAIVGVPATGDVLAAGAVERSSVDGGIGLSSGPVVFSSAYQAGSVFKLVTVAAAVDAGVADADRWFTVPDRIQVDDRTFSDHERHPIEQMTTTDIVARSSNVGSIMLAQELGAERLHEALKGFGFGRPTGVGHPAESGGILSDVADWTRPDLAASAIGTSQSATAIQLWGAYNVIANRGRYVAPRLVDAVVAADGSRHAPAVPAPRQVISPEAADEVGRMLEAVVSDGTAQSLDLPGYAVAAKTGTSRMPSPTLVDPEDAYIWPDGRRHYLAAFTGYFPADRPQVSITVLLEDLPEGMTGGSAAGPVFDELARLSIRELQIAPAGSTQVVPGGRVRAQPAATPGT